jgi:hypothetical protein
MKLYTASFKGGPAMSWSCSIHLTGESGDPLTNYKILILFSDFIRSSATEITDGDGVAHFENEYADGPQSVDSITTYLGLFGGTEVELSSSTSMDDGESPSFTVPDDEFRDASDLP